MFGAGTFHHIAFHVDTDNDLVQQKALCEELGYTDAVGDQGSVLLSLDVVRSPGGILVECTANVPGGFYQDEAPEELGTKLHLPPWYEEQRDDILAQLEPLTVPEVPAEVGGGGLAIARAAAGRADIDHCAVAHESRFRGQESIT